MKNEYVRLKFEIKRLRAERDGALALQRQAERERDIALNSILFYDDDPDVKRWRVAHRAYPSFVDGYEQRLFAIRLQLAADDFEQTEPAGPDPLADIPDYGQAESN